MRKSLVIIGLILLMMIPVSTFAQENDDIVWDSMYRPGSITANIGVGYVYFGFGVTGGIDFYVYQLKIADVIPLDFSIAGRAGIGGFGWIEGMGINASGFATVHFSFGGLRNAPAWLDKTDIYGGLGIGMNLGINGGLGFASMGGGNYFLNDNLAIFLEWVNINQFGSNYWYGWTYNSTFGVLFKI